jgi:GNAT superfamily N-acetyltransferase
MRPAVRLATNADIASWLEIVREVEPLFGPMPLFDVTLKSNIARGTALCADNSTGGVTGGLLLGGEAPDHWIRWLGVRISARTQGVGNALVQEAVARCPRPCTISLATFGADNVQGKPARELYGHLGFVAGEMLPRGPEGGTRQRFTLVRS